MALGGAFATPVFGRDGHNGTATSTPTGTETGTPPGANGEDEFEDDIAILNYALTLEYLEANFYREALGNISEEQLVSSEPVAAFGDPIKDRVYSDLQVIRNHEETHVEALTSTIQNLGGEPVDEPTFDFGTAVEEPPEFIATAAVLEDTGVAAYAGAAPSIENQDLLPPALSIHSVEARHASFVRVVGGMIGFPSAFDEPMSRSEVLEAAGQFIVE